MANRGLKRICASCGIKFYDMNKQPIKCPACGAAFTGEVAVKSRRSKSSIVPDSVNRDEIEAKNATVEEDDDTVSLDELEDDIDDVENDDDMSDVNADIVVDLDKDDA